MSKKADKSIAAISEEFVALVLKSPVALITLVLSTFIGYGIAYVVFNYQVNGEKNFHYLFHPFLGLGYTAIVFGISNYDLLTRTMTVDQISSRMPWTLLLSLAGAFAIIVSTSIYRQVKGN